MQWPINLAKESYKYLYYLYIIYFLLIIYKYYNKSSRFDNKINYISNYIKKFGYKIKTK